MTFKIDDHVFVTTPKHKDSLHTAPFVGTVVSVSPYGKMYEVIDKNDEVYSVLPDELEPLGVNHDDL